jgi:hypothetical protein
MLLLCPTPKWFHGVEKEGEDLREVKSEKGVEDTKSRRLDMKRLWRTYDGFRPNPLPINLPKPKPFIDFTPNYWKSI